MRQIRPRAGRDARREGRNKIAAMPRYIVLLCALTAVAATCAATSRPAEAKPCDLGQVIAKRPLLLPSPSTFYSVDVLNPDVVRKGRTYYMFFSGNREHTPAGLWRTGLATSRSPLGPFRVQRGLRGTFLNGGTTMWRGRFWQATSHYRYGNVLMSSRNGRRWRRVAQIPAPDEWPTIADFYLRPRGNGLRAYMLVRATNGAAVGGTIAALDWRHGKWSGFRTLLAPGPLAWENTDLGEPGALQCAWSPAAALHRDWC